MIYSNEIDICKTDVRRTRMCSCVSFQIECVVKTFATERAQVSLDVTVTFHMPV